MVTHTLRNSFAALAGLTALAAAPQAGAALYTSAAAFVAAAGTARAALPATLAETGSFGAAPFTLTGVGGTFVIDAATYGNAIPGENNLLVNGTESFDLHAATPLYAFGFELYQPSQDFPAAPGQVSCYYTCDFGSFTVQLRSGATLVDSFTFTPGADSVEFRGYAGATAFDKISIIDGSGSIDDEYFANFRYSASPVPLPAAVWLTIPALGGLVARRRTS
jgi:hypothetical protein